MRHTTPPVTLVPHPESAELAAAIPRCAPRSWRGAVFRFTDFTYANLRDLFTGAGSLKAGGRWNPKGGFRTLYFSLTAETALAEALAQHRSQAVPDVEATPLVLVGARVSARRLFNLTDASTRRRLGLTVARIRGPWRPAQHAGQEALTQAVGRLAREHGFQGLLAPSAARRRGVNLVLFPDRLGTHDLVAVHDEKFPLVRRRLRRK